MGSRSVDYRDFVSKLFVNRSDKNEGLAHGAIGMAGELGELLDALKKHWVYGKPLDAANVIEEIGDFYWYAQAYFIAAGLGNLPEFVDVKSDDPSITGALVRAASALQAAATLCDRTVARLSLMRDGPFYGGFHEPAFVAIREIDKLCRMFGFARDLALNANVEKLLKRYPGGYTNAAAIARADKEAA